MASIQPNASSIRFRRAGSSRSRDGGRAAVDRGTARPPGDVRADVHRAQLLHEIRRVIALVGAQRDRPRAIRRARSSPAPRGVRHGPTPRQPRIDDQPGAVLHQPMPDEAELRLHARPLAIEHGVGIGRALVRPCAGRPEIDGALRPPPSAGGSSPPLSFPWNDFRLAHASIKVPSTLKCSVGEALHPPCAKTAARNSAAMSPSSSRSRLFEGSNGPRPDHPPQQPVDELGSG